MSDGEVLKVHRMAAATMRPDPQLAPGPLPSSRGSRRTLPGTVCLESCMGPPSPLLGVLQGPDRGHVPVASEAGLENAGPVHLECLKSSVLRELEIEAGANYSDGSRLCFDIVEAALASSKFSRKEKGSIKALTRQA
eukprot:2115073-Pyramimonas_sp.AAC.1